MFAKSTKTALKGTTVFVVYWHPEPKSFNHAMFERACDTLRSQGALVKTSDLYAMDFNPVSGRDNFKTVYNADYLKLQLEEIHASGSGGFSDAIEAELAKLNWCDLMIWQFPLWWFGLPAALKGWVDRVFAMGRVYGGSRMFKSGILKGKRACLSLSTGGPESMYCKEKLGDINTILKPIHRGILNFVGFDVLAPHVVYGPAAMNDAQRQHELDQFEARLAGIVEESPIDSAYS